MVLKGHHPHMKGKTMTDTTTAPQPARSRAVFSQEDFSLIRTAIAHYLREVQDRPESVKYANLYHRLGRVA
jgi:predicted Zn-dependent peptidase